MTGTSPTQSALAKLQMDMNEVKDFIIRMEPVIKCVNDDHAIIHTNGQGLLMRTKMLEEWRRQETESVFRKLGVKALEIALSGLLMASIVWLLAGNLVK